MNRNITVVAFSWILFSCYLIAPMNVLAIEKKPMDSTTIHSDRSNLVVNISKDLAKDNITKILFILGLVSTVGFLGWRLSRQGNVPVAGLVIQGQKRASKPLIDQVNPRLRRKLLRLINDPKTANRLLVGIHKHNRNRSPNWLAEKAIYDLRRGR